MNTETLFAFIAGAALTVLGVFIKNWMKAENCDKILEFWQLHRKDKDGLYGPPLDEIERLLQTKSWSSLFVRFRRKKALRIIGELFEIHDEIRFCENKQKEIREEYRKLAPKVRGDLSDFENDSLRTCFWFYEDKQVRIDDLCTRRKEVSSKLFECLDSFRNTF